MRGTGHTQHVPYAVECHDVFRVEQQVLQNICRSKARRSLVAQRPCPPLSWDHQKRLVRINNDGIQFFKIPLNHTGKEGLKAKNKAAGVNFLFEHNSDVISTVSPSKVRKLPNFSIIIPSVNH